MQLSAEEKGGRERQRAAALSERDAARYVGMSESWLRHGRLYQSDSVPPHVRVGARAIRYRVIDLDRFLAERVTAGSRAD